MEFIMAQNYNHYWQNLEWRSEIKYKTFRVDTKNRNKIIILTQYFCVLEKSMYPIHTPFNHQTYIDYDKLSQMKQPIYNFLLNRGGKLEIIDNLGDTSIGDRLLVKSVHDIDFWLSDSEGAAIEKIKEAYEHHMNSVPYDVNVYLVNEQ